jgi:hypothetical protein
MSTPHVLNYSTNVTLTCNELPSANVAHEHATRFAMRTLPTAIPTPQTIDPVAYGSIGDPKRSHTLFVPKGASVTLMCFGAPLLKRLKEERLLREVPLPALAVA